MRRGVEFVLACVGLVLCAPIILMAILAIKMSSPGPVLFTQERIGMNLEPFVIYKLRTMHHDSNKDPTVASSHNDRVFPVGSILRKLKIDELPQLVNIIRGEMAFVGPRPMIPKWVNLYPNAYQSLLRVRPGVTDIATLFYRNEEDMLADVDDPEHYYCTKILPHKIALCRWGVERSSLLFDAGIILATLLGKPDLEAFPVPADLRSYDGQWESAPLVESTRVG